MERKPVKPKLLIVEDNLELRHFLKENFEEQYCVFEAGNGREGLQVLKQYHPDMIVSDVMMPEMNGIDFCKAIKENTETSHIPLLLLTAKSAVENRIEGKQSGADYFVSKPFSLEELTITINNALQTRQQLRELYLNNAFAEARELALNERDKDFMDRLMEIIEGNLDSNEF